MSYLEGGHTKDFGPVVDTNEACKPSQRWILLVGLGSLVWAQLKTICLITILDLENNN